MIMPHFIIIDNEVWHNRTTIILSKIPSQLKPASVKRLIIPYF